jgi:hypothetical protein
MPRRDNIGLRLSQCQDLGQMIRVRCYLCQMPPRLYWPNDMIQLVGDREVDSMRRRRKCERCGKRDYMEVEGVHLQASEKQGAVVRHLLRIETRRRPVWEDRRLWAKNAITFAMVIPRLAAPKTIAATNHGSRHAGFIPRTTDCRC